VCALGHRSSADRNTSRNAHKDLSAEVSIA
jgi:hypothetical protein